ncbi:MAG: methyltransferase [Gammaproteobacteria bacterium]|nr:MAG: methyltransferase [Gammaproteobacteria bacterium]
MSDKPCLASVKEQYESFPYPHRNPDDESRRLIHAISGNLLVINHHCFRGQRDFRSGFRCLVAGGGTGDTLIYLAEQLRHHDAEVVYLDMSSASRAVAEARARVRNLTNITWITASIMELPQLGLGKFDYIECCGVLHHLESTEAGLQALNAVLRDDGAIFLMLYGRYGRQAVYDMQALLRDYLPAGLDMAKKVAMARQLLKALPPSNSFIRDLDSWSSEISPEGGGDAGLYDLLLHSQDRCFDVHGLYALAASAGLHLLSFAVNADAYDPLNHIRDAGLQKHLMTLGRPRREALAEVFTGNLRKHEFFLARRPNRGASLGDKDHALRSFGTLLENASRLAADMVPGRTIHYADPDYRLDIACTPMTKTVFSCMDGATSLRTLRKRLLKSVPGATPAAVERELERVYNQLHPRGYLYLISAGEYGVTVPDYATLR